MSKYQNKSFSVYMGGDKNYEKQWKRIFRKTNKDLQKNKENLEDKSKDKNKK